MDKSNLLQTGVAVHCPGEVVTVRGMTVRRTRSYTLSWATYYKNVIKKLLFLLLYFQNSILTRLCKYIFLGIDQGIT